MKPTIKGALPGPLIESGRRWMVLLSCGHQREIIASKGKPPRGELDCEECRFAALADEPGLGPDDVTGEHSVFDPAARAAEKQASRDRDASMLESGEITREELARKNVFLPAAGTRIDLSRTKRLV
jgi:hypothetical protein